MQVIEIYCTIGVGQLTRSVIAEGTSAITSASSQLSLSIRELAQAS